MAWGPFHSERLVYSSYSPNEHDEFFTTSQSDPNTLINSSPCLPRPADAKYLDSFLKQLLETSILFVVIHIWHETRGRGEPIGMLFLTAASPEMTHHRFSELGIDITAEYRSQGYGREAIQWALDWGFATAGLNRVELNLLGWNLRPMNLYERIGFREEGRRRQVFFKDDQWWDEVHMGILKPEWESKRLASTLMDQEPSQMAYSQ
ncbi:Acyl-CoA N-acyltransferase [Penicillium chermesinum]|uniref:Acyl-CoA N-acyltransferase n=1 Tax=Penicillium chermesinum TaxID=63820 RepID=A0A9W9PMH9_9EURO|nr:Acyl-CoA N-acyltransferase [Penicillium chermesinum]KAJ5249145.1 Acyl-CoA N-acyltransferase [Penicillium chermesinum]